MTDLKIIQTAEGFAVVLTDELAALLEATNGGRVHADVSGEGQLLLTGLDTSPEARRERGRAFIQRYRATFEALAK